MKIELVQRWGEREYDVRIGKLDIGVVGDLFSSPDASWVCRSFSSSYKNKGHPREWFNWPTKEKAATFLVNVCREEKSE